MLEILIIEDDNDKLKAISDCIKEIHTTLSPAIKHVSNIIAAREIIEKRHFDIIILDLFIPLRENETPDPENCRLLLDDLDSSPFLKMPLFVIGLTKFTELSPIYSEMFERRLFYLLNYQYDSVEWREKLKKIIFHLVKQDQDFVSPEQIRYKYDAAIITALYDPEFLEVLELSTSWEKVFHTDDPTVYYIGKLQKNGKEKTVIAAYCDQMGMVATATLTMKIIMKFRPKFFIMTGITAGIKSDDVNYGDILLSDLCWDYGSGKIKSFIIKNEKGEETFSEMKFEPEPRSIPISSQIKNRIISYSKDKFLLSSIQNSWKGSAPEFVLRAHLGPLASGSQVVASSQRLSEIKAQHRKLLGIEMEAYGVFFACSQIFNSQVTPIIIKSVCDFGNEIKNDQYQKYAAFTSAQFMKHLLLDMF